MFFKEINDQIDKLKEQIDVLSENRKTLCRRSFLIQSEEIKDKIIKLKDKLKNDTIINKEKLKNQEKYTKEKINKLEKSLNTLVLSDSKLYKKGILENLYFISVIIVSNIPTISLIGFFFLYMYLYKINATIYLLEIASTGGIWFFFTIGSLIFLFQWIMPICIIGNQSQRSRLSDYIFLIIFYLASIILSSFGFFIFLNNKCILSITASLIWHAIVFCIAKSHENSIKMNKSNRNYHFGLIPFFGTIFLIATITITNIFIDIKFEDTFKLIGFNQKDYSWFMINKSYFDRTGIKVSDIKFKEKEFTDRSENIYLPSSNSESIFLYGKLWINSTTIKVLCPPKFKQDNNGKLIRNEKGQPEILDEIPNVSETCIKFQAEDLQSMHGLLKKNQ